MKERQKDTGFAVIVGLWRLTENSTEGEEIHDIYSCYRMGALAICDHTYPRQAATTLAAFLQQHIELATVTCTGDSTCMCLLFQVGPVHKCHLTAAGQAHSDMRLEQYMLVLRHCALYSRLGHTDVGCLWTPLTHYLMPQLCGRRHKIVQVAHTQNILVVSYTDQH